MLLSIVVFALLRPVLGVNRYVIDEKSCGPRDSETYRNVVDSVETALRWAGDAAFELGKPENERHPAITEKAKWILGNDPASIKRTQDIDAFGQDWKAINDWSDVDSKGKSPYICELTTSGIPEGSTAYNLIKGGDEPQAVTLSWRDSNTRGNPNLATKLRGLPSTITINPKYLKKIREAGWKRFNKERIQKAMSPDLVKKVDQGIENFANKFLNVFGASTEFQSDVDILATLEVTFLHEVLDNLLHWFPEADAESYV
ncbi:uncharacterized protein ColSpa_08668 [Colletotrichum spaethianum]|uniref:Uncharacterized protein n=1 Tax=Colletotrichum spaethianum TaxID=700344 RepID=A0AA37PA63_9PEZI|nr:uncharacterized protein ColSpa_08668 [Colletotrichum spaethianum]GKT48487.1 hypothetical protein ColSpa_08668 [Colletotrichum spaethianum]